MGETFLIAWRKLDHVPPGDAELPWLFGVARRVLANHNRGARRRLVMVERLRADLSWVAPAPARTTELEQALAQLSATDRELLLLLAWDGLSQEQAVLALGISHSALRVRLHRARARLRTHLAADQWDLNESPIFAEGMNHA